MGRREDREAIEASWNVYEAREPGRPFRKRDLEDADELASLREAEGGYGASASTGTAHLSAMLPRTLIARGWRQR